MILPGLKQTEKCVTTSLRIKVIFNKSLLREILNCFNWTKAQSEDLKQLYLGSHVFRGLTSPVFMMKRLKVRDP